MLRQSCLHSIRAHQHGHIDPAANGHLQSEATSATAWVSANVSKAISSTVRNVEKASFKRLLSCVSEQAGCQVFNCCTHALAEGSLVMPAANVHASMLAIKF